DYVMKKIHFLDGFSTAYDSMKRKISEAERDVRRIEEELERLRTYYEAPASTKWKVLVLYIGLAAVLSFFYIYGQQITNQVLL
ncbi:MAG TPA: hypothetical protein VF199_14900, partial [Bacillales bacterium]